MRSIRFQALAAVAAFVVASPALAQTDLPPDTVRVAVGDVAPVVDPFWSLGGHGIEGVVHDPAASVGRVAAVHCPAGGRVDLGRVWGTFVYTYDSMICAAAVHAGWIGIEEGGTTWIEFVPGRTSYAGSARNGVESGEYGAFGLSFRFVLPEEEPKPAVPVGAGE